MRKIITMILIFLLVQAFVFTACSSDSEESGVTDRSYIGTQAPGDVWEWTISTGDDGSGTFSATNRTLGNDYSGDVETLPNDFLKLTVTATTEPGFTPPAEAYALEIPDTVLFIKPVGDNTKVIVCTARGECPTADTTYNWIKLLEYPFDLYEQVYGTAATTVSGADFDVAITSYRIDGTNPVSGSDTGYSCSEGEITHPTESTVVGITPSGALIIDYGPSAGGGVGFESPSTDVELADVTASSREYRGVPFIDRDTGAEDGPVWIRPDGTGGLNGGSYNDFDAGIEGSSDVNITFTTQSSPGIINGKLTQLSSSETSDSIIVVNQIDGRYFLYSAGYCSNDTDEPFNFIAIEQ